MIVLLDGTMHRKMPHQFMLGLLHVQALWQNRMLGERLIAVAHRLLVYSILTW